MHGHHSFIITLSLIALSLSSLHGQLPDHLFQMSELNYKGAFRIPASTYGSSSMNFSEGPLAYNQSNHSIFIVGHDHHQSIAEFSIPPLASGSIDDLNMATNLQPFISHLDHVNCGNTQNINQIGGLAMIDGKLYVNAYEYYDANGDVTHTTLILDEPSQLATSQVKGYFAYEGGAGHTAGWISDIPQEWQDTLETTHMTGSSSGIPIISRTSVGPSAFAFTPALEDSCTNGTIFTDRLLDFSLDDPLHTDLSNTSGTNDIWTHLSRATYGMIIPGTRTYLTLGYSGGHQSGVCYKCTQDNGNTCGGYCAPIASDYQQHYWLWDMDDLLAVKAGTLLSHEVRPYDYGPFVTPFQNDLRQIGGGTYDATTNTLYLTIQRADTEQGTYANPPIIVAYEMALGSCHCCASALEINTDDIYDGMDIYSTDFITSDAMIAPNHAILWKAGERIDLISPFELSLWSQLTLLIGDCPE